MLKILALIDTPIWMLIVAFLLVIVVAQRRKMRGLDQPELWLPRKERQAYARELLARERGEYEQETIRNWQAIAYGWLVLLAIGLAVRWLSRRFSSSAATPPADAPAAPPGSSA